MLASRFLKNFAPVIIAVKVLALQHLGPPISAMFLNASATACIARDLSLSDMTVAPVKMLTAIPTHAAAPQTPREPHDPKGISLPLLSASSNVAPSALNFVAFLRAAKRVQATR